MPKLQCIKCNYELEKEDIPNRCPYCSAEGTLGNLKIAQNFLDET